MKKFIKISQLLILLFFLSGCKTQIDENILKNNNDEEIDKNLEEHFKKFASK